MKVFFLYFHNYNLQLINTKIHISLHKMNKFDDAKSEETFVITFKNEVNEITHSFLKKNIKNEGFFRGLLNMSLKEGLSDKATVHFTNAGGIIHPIYFPLDPFVFQTMEDLFQKGKSVLWDGDKFTWLAKGKLVYQLDKLLDYFLCTKFKSLILKGCHQRLTTVQGGTVPSGVYFCTSEMEDIVYTVLTLMDNKHKYLNNAISIFYQNITSGQIDKKKSMERIDYGLNLYFQFYQEIMKIVNETDFYRLDPDFFSRLLFLLNRIRGSISDGLLQDLDLSEYLLLTPEMMEGYFQYAPPSESNDARTNFSDSMIAEFSSKNLESPKSYELGQNMILSHDETILQFKLMTQGMLENMPWDNVALCGGSVNIILDASLNPSDFPASDIDLFIYGKNAEERRDGLRNVLRHFFEIKRRKFIAVNQSVVGIFIEDCPTVFQIVISNATSILDIIHHFDLDHLRMAFDGNQFLMTIEAAEALRTKCSHINKWGITIKRIWKTLTRGYNIIGDINLSEDCIRMGAGSKPRFFTFGKDHSALLDNITKYDSLQYKYYFPRTGESSEKVKYEISIHYPYSSKNIFEGNVGRNETDLISIFKDINLEEANFRKLIGNSYLSVLMDINMSKIIFSPQGLDLRSYRKYMDIWNCIYLHSDPLGDVKQNITVATPLCRLYRTSSLFDRDSLIKHFTLTIFNKDFINSVRKITLSLFETLQTKITFIEWIANVNKKMNERNYRPLNDEDNKIYFNDKITDTYDDSNFHMLVKVNANDVNIYLSNGHKIDAVTTRNIVINNKLAIGTRLKIDLIIRGIFVDLERKYSSIYYYTRNIYLMNDGELCRDYPMIGQQIGRSTRMSFDENDEESLEND